MINGTQVGFGAALLAAVVLALIGPPGTQVTAPAPAPAVAVSPNAPKTFALKSVSVELPTSDVAFPGPANNQAITANCLACHSAGMVLTQPDFARAVWAGEVDKMIHAFKAPVSPADVSAIVDYLAATKGTK